VWSWCGRLDLQLASRAKEADIELEEEIHLTENQWNIVALDPGERKPDWCKRPDLAIQDDPARRTGTEHATGCRQWWQLIPIQAEL
jgi:hypothetical protein